MEKQKLIKKLESLEINDEYKWEIYLFGIDRRNNNPFNILKLKFKSNDFLIDYGKGLSQTVIKYQLNKIEEIQDYNGDNPKITCDKLNLEGIKSQWSFLCEAIKNNSNEIKGKIKGYIVCAIPKEKSDKEAIIFIKKANPIIEVKNKRNVLFTMDENKNLNNFKDKTYRFYLTVDFLVIENKLYTFNLNFEEIFNLEKTLKKNKDEYLKEIFDCEIIENKEESFKFFNKISSKKYMTFDIKKLDDLKESSMRLEILKKLKIEKNDKKEKITLKEEDAKKIIDYLCCKILKDFTTENLYEVNNPRKVE